MKKTKNSRLLLEEEKLYRRVHENGKKVLEEVGVRITHPETIKILEGTGMAGYDKSCGRIIIESDYTQHCIDLAPKTFAGDPGYNSFGIGGIPPFYKRETGYPSPASFKEFKNSIDKIAKNLDIIKLVSPPVKINKGDDFRYVQVMDDLPCLKLACSIQMKAKETKHFVGRNDWIDSFCLIQSPLYVPNKSAEKFLISARLGNNLAATTMSMAGWSAPYTPEGLMTIAHAESLFALVIAQTVNPGIVCLHGGMPLNMNGYNLAYGSYGQSLINAAMARLNMWVTKLPSIQSGASTDQEDLCKKALDDGRTGRKLLRNYGFHIMRHAFGNLDNLNYFSLEKMLKEVKQERADAKKFKKKKTQPLYIPKDNQALKLIEMVEREKNSDYWTSDHTRKNIDCWNEWERKLRKK